MIRLLAVHLSARPSAVGTLQSAAQYRFVSLAVEKHETCAPLREGLKSKARTLEHSEEGTGKSLEKEMAPLVRVLSVNIHLLIGEVSRTIV